jgi:hypothetical protein
LTSVAKQSKEDLKTQKKRAQESSIMILALIDSQIADSQETHREKRRRRRRRRPKVYVLCKARVDCQKVFGYSANMIVPTTVYEDT